MNDSVFAAGVEVPGPCSRSDGSPSSPYNMELAETGQKLICSGGAVASLTLDKLRLMWWWVGGESRLIDKLGREPDFRTRGRNAGRFQSSDSVWMFYGGKGVPGNVWACLRQSSGKDSAELIMEFNPAKMASVDLSCLGMTLGELGLSLSDAFVDRWDVAVDYAVRRGFLLLDVGNRKVDWFGVGSWGPETERAGFRKGSKVKWQLYDKAAEREARGLRDELTGPLSRFEVQSSDKGVLRLGDLSAADWPGQDVTVRVFQWDPATVADVRGVAFGMMARAIGLRAARKWARLRLSGNARKQVEWCMLPEIEPRPADVFRAGWGSAVDAGIGSLVNGYGGWDVRKAS